jgi:hypothetical protein
MRLILIPVAALALAACSAEGGFVSPSKMTPDERCANAATLLAILDSEDASEDTMRRARVLADVACQGSALAPEAAVVEPEA